MSKPKRIQRKRKKGWRMPEGAVYVGRPSKWGNPFLVKKLKFWNSWSVYLAGGVELSPAFATRRHALMDAVARYPEWVDDMLKYGYLDIEQLRGKDLACWCPLDQPCHADILLELANK